MKKNKTTLTQPLSESELNRLATYLNSQAQIFDDCLNLEMVDGLFCALIVNPLMAKPAEWMNMIFGKKQAFKSDLEMENIFNLLVRHWNHTSILIEKNAPYQPLLLEDNENTPIAEQWATGFFIGMNYCRQDWDEFNANEENIPLLAPFVLLKQGHHLDNREQKLTDQERRQLLAQIPEITHTLFFYWLEKLQMENTTPKVKVGRNDPCPCGSGKKYKKCCEGKESVGN